MEEVLTDLQLMHLIILPPYTYDDDEDSKQIEEYAEYYQVHIAEALSALEHYAICFVALLKNRNSEDAFSAFINARKRYVVTIPFCFDEIPYDDAVEFSDICRAMHDLVANEKNSRSCINHIMNLLRFRDLLREFDGLVRS